MSNKTGVYFFVFLLLVSLVAGAPPVTQTAEGAGGLTIEYPKYTSTRMNQQFSLHTHVYNTSDGVFITPDMASCELHIYNESGNHVLEGEMYADSNDKEFAYYMTAENFSVRGRYSYIIQCNTTDQGGFVSGLFDVTPDGIDPEDECDVGIYVIMFFMLLIGLCFYVGLKIEDAMRYTFLIAGFLFLDVGLYLVAYFADYNFPVEPMFASVLWIIFVIMTILLFPLFPQKL